MSHSFLRVYLRQSPDPLGRLMMPQAPAHLKLVTLNIRSPLVEGAYLEVVHDHTQSFQLLLRKRTPF